MFFVMEDQNFCGSCAKSIGPVEDFEEPAPPPISSPKSSPKSSSPSSTQKLNTPTPSKVIASASSNSAFRNKHLFPLGDGPDLDLPDDLEDEPVVAPTPVKRTPSASRLKSPSPELTRDRHDSFENDNLVEPAETFDDHDNWNGDRRISDADVVKPTHENPASPSIGSLTFSASGSVPASPYPITQRPSPLPSEPTSNTATSGKLASGSSSGDSAQNRISESKTQSWPRRNSNVSKLLEKEQDMRERQREREKDAVVVASPPKISKEDEGLSDQGDESGFDRETGGDEPRRASLLSRSSSNRSLRRTSTSKTLSPSVHAPSHGLGPHAFNKEHGKRVSLRRSQTFSAAEGAEEFVMTVAELEEIKAEIRSTILRQTNEELAIVAMEHEEAVRQHDIRHKAAEEKIQALTRKESEWAATKAALEQTLEELMNNLENTLSEYGKEKSTFTATIALLETDINRLRLSLGAVETEKKTAQEEMEKLKTASDAAVKGEAAQSEKVKTLESELANAKVFLEQLRQRAETKLKSAHSQFVTVQKEAAEKTAQVRSLEGEVESLKQQVSLQTNNFASAQAAMKQQEERASRLDRSLAESEARATDLSTNLSNTQMELASTRRQATELLSVSNIYKEQLSTANEELRRFKADAEVLLKVTEENQKISKQLEVLNKENKELKSRLFDMGETERRLRAQVSGGGSALSDDSQQRIDELSKALQGKELENKELVSICDELLQQVEILKRGGTS